MCGDHVSKNDSELCCECGASPDQEIQTKNELVDVDGGTHSGRELRPVGEYYITTAGEISTMTDDELDRFYRKYSDLVRQCEAALDRHRIIHSMISVEKGERDRNKRKKKYNFPTPEKVAEAVASSGDKKLEILAAVLKRAGVTKEKLQEMIDKKKKEAANHATTVVPNSDGSK